jgi:copper(I)-binding protein
MSRSSIMKSNIARLAAFSAAAVIIAGVAASPAMAHAPKPGATCAMSGMTAAAHSTTYVCTQKGTAKPRWSKGLPMSKSLLTISDAWTKAAASGMTASFGVLKNPTAKTINIIAATSPAAASLQLHEVISKDGAMVMQQKPGGFVIPAGGTYELKPGGNHIMFMSLKAAIKPGEMVPVTLIMSDGSRMPFMAMAKVFTGAAENYDATSGSMTMGSSTMGSMS